MSNDPAQNPKFVNPMRGNSIRIGDLLIRAGILDPNEVDDAIQIAAQINLPFGRVLVMSNYVDPDTLKAALEIQSMINDKVLSLDSGVTALTLVKREKIDIDRALAQVGFKKQSNRPTNKLGELLLDAQIINDSQLEQSLARSYESGLPLGRILVQLGVLSQTTLAAALNAQVMIRDNKVSKEQAIAGLKAAAERRVSVEQMLREQGVITEPAHKNIRVGELLVMSHLLSEKDLLTALELGLVKEQLIGDILVSDGFISKQSLAAALQLQKHVSEGKISGMQAADALRISHSRGISVDQAIRELTVKQEEEHKPVAFPELLKMCGFITDKDVEQAIQSSLQNPKVATQLFLAVGILDEAILNAALRCHFLLEKKAIQLDQAIIALNYCHRSRLSLDDTLEEFGWQPPPDLKQ